MKSQISNPYSIFLMSLSGKEKNNIAAIKRFQERYCGDDEFRNHAQKGQIIYDIKNGFFTKNIEDLLFLFNKETVEKISKNIDGTIINTIKESYPLSYLWLRYMEESKKFRYKQLITGDSHGITPKFDYWRNKNIDRTSFELGASANGIVHAPISFELSDGCSVGCPFCGISATKFRGHFSLENGGEKHWSEILINVKSLLGDGVKTGFCYWATEPLDNPEYLNIIKIFHEIIGVYPQTTTAIPLRNVELTKGILKFWNQDKSIPNRFSILTKSILRKVHETFNADELLGVELILQNKESLYMQKALAGRIFKDEVLSEKTMKIYNSNTAKNNSYTIACVTGFLINLVTKNIKLISPTTPTKKWPNGFIIFDESKYEKPNDVLEIMNKMINKFMNKSPQPEMKLRFADNFSFEEINKNLYIKSPNLEVRYLNVSKLFELIKTEKYNSMDIFSLLTKNGGMDPLRVVTVIQDLWDHGLLIY